MTAATPREIDALLIEYPPSRWQETCLSTAQLLLLQAMPARWLSPNLRAMQRAVREMSYYQRLMREVFVSLNLCQKLGRGHGEKRTYTYKHVRFGYVDMLDREQQGENTYRWRIDAYPLGVRMSRFLEPQVERNLQLALGCPVRVLQTNRVWIVVNPCNDRGQPDRKPGKLPDMVALRSMTPPGEPGLWLPIGVDGYAGQVWHNLASEGFPHLLVGGATGSGKSNVVNCWLAGLCARHTPEQLRLWLVDLKRVELADYASLPHAARVAKEEQDVAPLLDALIGEMQARYRALEQAHARHVARLQDPPPRLLLVVDELATLALGAEGKDNLARLERIAQLGRAAGIHVILATQRPSVDVCPGSLKANVPARLGLAMATMQDSRVILDQNGAEELTPPGQAILVRGTETLTVMTPYLPDDERAQRLCALRLGEIELTEDEKLVMQEARGMMQEGIKVTTRTVGSALEGKLGQKRARAALKRLREMRLLAAETAEDELAARQD